MNHNYRRYTLFTVNISYYNVYGSLDYGEAVRIPIDIIV